MILDRSRSLRLLGGALILPAFLSLFAGCGSSSLPTPVPTGVTITAPKSAEVDPGDSTSVSATVANDDNAAGVRWSLSGMGCTGTACGTLTGASTTAVSYTAPATVATAFTVALTATSVAKPTISAATTLSVPVNPSITTAAGALPAGVAGAAYTTNLAATGGISPYMWSASAGALPAGLTLNSSTGMISGIPTASGDPSFTVTLTDSGSPALTANASYTLAVAYPALAITSTSIPNATLGTAYSQSLAASGGSGSGYTWTVISGAGLSASGLSLSPAGVISGIPTAAETAVPFTVQITDSANNRATATLALTVTSVAFQGQVLSGGQGIAGATIQMYAVGSSGTGSASIPMLTQPVTTDSAGYFTLTGLYTCGQTNSGAAIGATTPIYMTATGGSVGGNPANAAIALISAVGSCSSLTPTTYTYINELTTAAAVWALSPFTSSISSIGATSTNALGINNAFLDAALLVSPTTGAAAALPSNLTVETGKLSGFADALATCVNAAAASGCSPLFAGATLGNNGATAPTDTFTAALNIVQHPGQNVAAVFSTIAANGSTQPYPTTLTQSPNDWTMSLNVSGGGLVAPTAMGIDAQNNIWVANQAGPLSAFNAQGTPLSQTGFGISNGASQIAEVYGLAVDPSGNIWVTNTNGGSGAGSITKFLGATPSATLGQVAGTYSDPAGSVQYPYAIAADTNGNIFVSNSGTSSATVFDSAGTVVSGGLGSSQNLDMSPNAITLDAAHGFWESGDQNVAHIGPSTAAAPNGTLLANITCCAESYGMATDADGNLWIADYLGSSTSEGAVAEVTSPSSGPATVALSGFNQGGINHPAMVAVDAAQNIWLSNFIGNSITEIAGTAQPPMGSVLFLPHTITTGSTSGLPTAISPSAGVYGKGGYGLDASLGKPFTLLPDRSGNLWVSNEGSLSITMFFGLAAPTVTPLQPVPTAP
jgi:hypothetical protein